MVTKVFRRLGIFFKSLPALILALFIEPGKQPWQIFWGKLFLSSEQQAKITLIYLKRYYGLKPLDYSGSEFLMDFVFAKTVVSKEFCKYYLQMQGILSCFFDFLYPYTVKIKIPALLGHDGIYEQDEVRLKAGDVVIDAGANVGLFSFFAAGKIGPQGKVYAFEPIKEYLKIINASKNFNQQGQIVEAVPSGLAEKPDRVTLTYGQGATWDENPELVKIFSNEADIITLDEFIKSRGLTKVDFIKADIEGYERHLLKGAAETLAKFKPRLAICTYHLPDDVQAITNVILRANPGYKIAYAEKKLFAW